MQIITNIQNVHLENSIVILGKFDGLHKGHIALLSHALTIRKPGRKVVLFTFDIHPSLVLSGREREEGTPAFPYQTIDTPQERERLWQEKCGSLVDAVVVFPFNQQTLNMNPEDFVKGILVDRLGVCDIVAGSDFHFGKNRMGNTETLAKLGEKYHFSVHVIAKEKVRLSGYEEEQEISSTLIKKEISLGHMEEVQRMLGRPYSVSGKILHGKHLGHSLGFPTINMKLPEGKVYPPFGVYYTRTKVEGEGTYEGITNIGVRPSFDDGETISIETNLFQFDKQVYNRFARVDFCSFIREERKFGSLDELCAQIQKDVLLVKDRC